MLYWQLPFIRHEGLHRLKLCYKINTYQETAIETQLTKLAHLASDRGIALSLLIKEVNGEVPPLPLFLRVRANADVSVFQPDHASGLDLPRWILCETIIPRVGQVKGVP